MDDRSALVMVGGVSGIGKTRLALEASRRAPEGFRVFTGQARDAGGEPL
jgi:predicted ATP-dependent serine protease